MFPFVTGRRGAARRARRGRAGARTRCARAAIDAPTVPIGVMIEVPSAALTVDLLAGEADFFSIGTNDLIQYCLAVDRTDDRVSALYAPLHPAILRMLRHVARGARRRGIPVVGLRRDGRGSGAAAAARRARAARVQHGAGGDSAGQAGRPRPAASPTRARLASRALRAATAAEVEQVLAEH